jgi:hypothetical protein
MKTSWIVGIIAVLAMLIGAVVMTATQSQNNWTPLQVVGAVTAGHGVTFVSTTQVQDSGAAPVAINGATTNGHAVNFNGSGQLVDSGLVVPPGSISGTTGSIGGGALLAGATTTGTATVTGATTGKPCIAAPSDGTSIAGLGVGLSINCSVTSSGTATVVITAAIGGTPTAKTYTVTVP